MEINNNNVSSRVIARVHAAAGSLQHGVADKHDLYQLPPKRKFAGLFLSAQVTFAA